jgi:tetratricopeptide (TPR) repeat protein
MTQLIITCRYLPHGMGDLLMSTPLQMNSSPLLRAKSQELRANLKKLEPICLTTFQPAEQSKKVRELEHIFNYPDLEVVDRLVAAGRGNPRLMEWLDILLGEMQESEVPLLLEAVKDKQKEFIRSHVIRELVQRGGEGLARFLGWLAIYRLPVLIDGVREIGEKAGIKGWEELLQRGIELSLVEHDRAGESYGVTPLLREELLTGVDSLKDCHWAAFSYYKKRCEPMESVDAVLVEEWIYHALGCGEEDSASKQGGRLVQHLRERLAFRESRRVGEWVLAGKNRELSTRGDAFLLNEIGLTIKSLGDNGKAIEYFAQALAIWKEVYGEKHRDVATALNNLGSAWDNLGVHRKAIEYYKQALAIDEAVFGKEHPNVAVDLNNLGEAWRVLGKTRKAIEYYEQTLAILKEVYGDKHPQIGAALSNLGAAYFAQGQTEKAKSYFELAYAIKLKSYGPNHPSSKLTAGWLEACTKK